MPPRPAPGQGPGRGRDPPPTGSVPGAEGRAARRPGPAGRGPCLGSRRGQPHPAATAPRPGGRPRPGDTHLRRRHPARPVRSSGNSARLLPRPPVPGRGRRPERTNQRRPPALAANGRLPSERSEGSLRRASASPPHRARSGPTSLGLNGVGLNHCGAARVGGRVIGRVDGAGAGSKSQRTGFGGLRSASRKAGSLGSQRGGRRQPPVQLPSQRDALIPGSGP